MKLLYASTMLPFPLNSGKRIEVWTTLKALLTSGHEVTMLSFADTEQTDVGLQKLRSVCPVDIVPLDLVGRSATTSYRGRLRTLFSPAPFDAVRFRSVVFRDRLLKHLVSGAYDAILCGDIVLLENIPAGVTTPVIVKKDLIAATLLQRYVRSEQNPLLRAYAWLEFLKTKRWEEAACRRASLIMACSETERRQLERMCPGVPVTLTPNVVDTDEYLPEGEEDAATVLYQGQMDWRPNQDAAFYFVEKILPSIRREMPKVRFVVAGRCSSPSFRKRLESVPNVEVAGTVPDMRPFMRAATVCVVPLRIAGGTRLKILEAAAMGKAIVSTTVGAEGLDFRCNEEIFVADAPDQFGALVCGLIRDVALRRAVGAAASRRVRSDYSLPVLCKTLDQSLKLLRPEQFGRLVRNDIPARANQV